VDKEKIIKIAFIILSVMLFLYLLTSSTKKAVLEVSKKANSSVQIFASNRAQVVFNEEVFRSYRFCKKRAKKNKNIHNYIEYCEGILNEASIPDDGYLTNISRRLYHYNWLSGTYSTKCGRVVYKMTTKDKYLTPGQCWLMIINKFLASLATSVLLAVLFYFALGLLEKLTKILIKTTIGRIIGAVLLMIFAGVYFTYKFHTMSGGGGGLALLNGNIPLSSDVPAILKIIITTLSALIVYKEFKVCKYSFWTIGFLLIAFIFNPVIPVVPVLESVGIAHFVNTLCEIFFLIYLFKEYKSFNA
jgi:hypothetical protein